MTWAATNSELDSVGGEVRFVGEATRVELESDAERAGLLVARIGAPTPAQRGRLALVIESAIEDALERRGASPPGVGASSDLDASLSDQLYRARLVGTGGLALSLESLEGIANLAAALDAEDSAVLRWWLQAAMERPVRLFLDAADRFLGVYAEPVSLRHLVDGTEGTPRPPPVLAADPELSHSSQTMELSDAPPPVAEICAGIHAEDDDADAEDDDAVDALDPSSDAEALARAMSALFDEAAESDDARQMEEHARVREAIAEASEAPAPVVEAPVVAVEPTEAAVATDDAAPATAHASEVTTEPAPPLDPNAAERWQTWMRELDAARGPKPLAAIERMFVSAYVPLADAVARGIAGAEAEPVLEAWADSFEKSYAEAFDALRVRGKRPSMVLDVPDIGLRVGRLHGARAVQLILVDGMRFDLGLRVNERLKLLVGQRAALTERLLLWSALPSTTELQVELIGRGPSGLREITDAAQTEIPVARGRAATTLRRIRAGHRELYKLDVVESALSVPGGPVAARLDALADETAEVLANHLINQPPRTLSLIFGDHGFVVDPMGTGTTAGSSGGASPDEVLVPAFAWLVGAVH